MNFGQKVFQFYIYSNLHVALATYCLVKLTLLPYTDSNIEALFVFFGTVLSYNFIRFFSVPETELFLSSFIIKNKQLLWGGCIVSLIGILFLIFQFNSLTLIFLVPFAVITFFYGIPFLYRFPKLRNVPSLKIFLIALVYVGITLFWPLLENNITIDGDIWFLAIQRFLFVIVITLPFDIRDVYVDKPSLKTLPQIMGVTKTKLLGIVLILVFVLLEFFKTKSSLMVLFITIIIALSSLIFLVFTTSKRSKYYVSFWVEGIPILWLIVTVVLSSVLVFLCPSSEIWL